MRNDLIARLRGCYTVPVNDGAGTLNGSTSFTRMFDVPPINLEAADEIERLSAALTAQAPAPVDERDTATPDELKAWSKWSARKLRSLLYEAQGAIVDSRMAYPREGVIAVALNAINAALILTHPDRAAASPVPAAEGLHNEFRRLYEAVLLYFSYSPSRRDEAQGAALDRAMARALTALTPQQEAQKPGPVAAEGLSPDKWLCDGCGETCGVVVSDDHTAGIVLCTACRKPAPVAAEGLDVETLARETAAAIVGRLFFLPDHRPTQVQEAETHILAALRAVAEARR